MKAKSQKSLYNNVYDSLVKRFNCWDDITIVKSGEYTISVEVPNDDIYASHLEASLEVARAYDLVYDNAKVFAMYDRIEGLCVRVSIDKD